MNPAGSQIVNAALMELKKSMGLFMHNARFPIQVAELFFPAWDGREGGTRESPVSQLYIALFADLARRPPCRSGWLFNRMDTRRGPPFSALVVRCPVSAPISHQASSVPRDKHLHTSNLCRLLFVVISVVAALESK